jgi:hypothetical protein
MQVGLARIARMKSLPTDFNSLRAGALYFLLVFAMGFAFGAIRFLFVAPRVGALVGVLIELPIILMLAWIVCGWVIVKMRVPRRPVSRLAMSACAFRAAQLARGKAVLEWNRSWRVIDPFPADRRPPPRNATKDTVVRRAVKPADQRDR